jgi:hypothetical protein
MKKIFPRFNQIEVNATADLTKEEKLIWHMHSA